MKKKKKAQILQPHPQQPRGAPVASFLSPASWAHLGLLTPVPPLLHTHFCYQPAPEEMAPHKQKLSFARTWQELRKPSQLLGTDCETNCLFNPTE